MAGDPRIELARLLEERGRSEQQREQELAARDRLVKKLHRTRFASDAVVAALPKATLARKTKKELAKENKALARAICELGRAWAEHPGANIHNEKAIPDAGLGVEQGYRLLDMAVSGATENEIEDTLARVREALMSVPDVPEFVARMEDYEIGVWIFFKQLARFYDGVDWLPPLWKGRNYVRLPDESTQGFTHYSEIVNRPKAPSARTQVTRAEPSADFSTVTWRGVTFQFNKTQAAVVKMLWPEAEKGRGLREETIGVHLKSAACPFRLKEVFRGYTTEPGTRKRRRLSHEAWEKLVVRLGDEGDVYTLVL